MASIPQELVEKIIDELRYRRVTLKECALTSKAFYPRASALLFEEIRSWECRERFDAFRDLCHQNPRLESLVKSLHISCREEATGGWLTETLPNVSALTLECMDLVGCAPPSSFGQLSTLRLITVILPRASEAQELFKNIPQLSCLFLRNISLSEREDSAPSESLPSVSDHYQNDTDCVHPRKLVLCKDNTRLQGSSVFTYRSRAYGVSFSRLEDLTFSGVDGAYEYKALEELVQNAAESLVNLDMRFPYGVPGVKPGHSPTKFIRIPRVRHISFALEDYSSDSPISILEWWLGNLEQFPHPSPVETITIHHIVDASHSEIGASQSHPIWRGLDTFLQGPCAPNFQCLNIYIVAPSWYNQGNFTVIKEVLLDSFPLLRKREKLDVIILPCF